jgi:hypothetical protein
MRDVPSPTDATAATTDLSPHKFSNLRELLSWYEANLCNVQLNDPRGYRVRFNVEDFVHLVKLTNKYGRDPKNRRLTIEDIRRANFSSETGRFDRKRALELPWAREISTQPDYICLNWQALGTGDEVFVKNFGSDAAPQYRVLVCKVRGTTRIAITIFPRERIAQRELSTRIWPPNSQGGL